MIYKVDAIADAMKLVQSIEAIIESAIENVDLVIIFIVTFVMFAFVIIPKLR